MAWMQTAEVQMAGGFWVGGKWLGGFWQGANVLGANGGGKQLSAKMAIFNFFVKFKTKAAPTHSLIKLKFKVFFERGTARITKQKTMAIIF